MERLYNSNVTSLLLLLFLWQVRCCHIVGTGFVIEAALVLIQIKATFKKNFYCFFSVFSFFSVALFKYELIIRVEWSEMSRVTI